MEYKILEGYLPSLSISLNKEESVYTQAKGATWISDGIEVDTNREDGFLNGIGRRFLESPLPIITYKAIKDSQEITFASTFPGNIVEMNITPKRSIICQKNVFLCAQPSVYLVTELEHKCSEGLFGGEGFTFQKVCGRGKIFLGLTGSVVTRELAHGEVLKVHIGNLVAFEQEMKYQMETIKGFKNILFGAEGVLLTIFTGPGKVWLQTITMQNFAGKIAAFI